MNKIILIFLALTSLSAHAQRFVIETPASNLESSIILADPDEQLSSLGKVSFILDFASANDNLFKLKIRRHEFLLPDGRKAEALAVREKDGLIIGAAKPVTQISIIGIEYNQGRRMLRAIFYGPGKQIMSPGVSDIAVFDLAFKLKDISYEPVGGMHPGSMEVSLLLDNSGSMRVFQAEARSAAREFLEGLPEFTRCHVFSFADDVTRLTMLPAPTCPDADQALSNMDQAGGGTALMDALDAGFQVSEGGASTLPNLVIAVTDGVNTVNPRLAKGELARLKSESNSKAIVYWIGAHDRDHLKDIADQEIMGRANVRSDLENFFDTIGVSISGIQSIEIH